MYSAQRWEDESEKRVALLENMKNRDVANLRESLRESVVILPNRSRPGGGGGGGNNRGTETPGGRSTDGVSAGGGIGGGGGGGGGGGRVRPTSARTVQSVRDAAWGVRDSDVWGPPPAKIRPASARQPRSRDTTTTAGASTSRRESGGGGGGGGGGRHPAAASAAWGVAPAELSTPEAVEAQRRALEERMARLTARESAARE